MKTPKPNMSRPELLAAFADGELDAFPDLKRQVAAWLQEDPDIQAQLEQLSHYQYWWASTAPDGPGARDWSALLARVQEQLEPVRAGNELSSRRVRLGRWLGGAAAMLACLGLGLGWLFLGSQQERPVPGLAPAPMAAGAEPLTVAAAEEVEILSVAGDDTHSLVIGELPIRGPLELLAAGEASLAEGHVADNSPEIRLRGPHRPMIWAKLIDE